MRRHLSCGIMLVVVFAICGCVHKFAPGGSFNRAKLTPADLSTIRGANYRAAGAANTTDYWLHYNPAETERDLSYADRLKVNQLRVFVNCAAWQTNQASFRKNLVDLAHAANRHHIGLMITIGDSASFIGKDGAINRPQIHEFVSSLVGTIGNEPALAFWDASNEPDYNAAGVPADRKEKRFEIARLIASELHEFDKKTPVTIGVAYETNMETLADAVDVLSFHDYLPTRAAISNDIARAKAFAAKSKKRVMDTETGCIARANPYDVTIEEHMNAHVGWYIWELMITKRWGDVHGVFYADGTVRDPSIPAAISGMFRNRTTNAILENVNRESWVNTDIQYAQTWLDNPAGSWNDGLNAAEKLANLLEAAQLVAMRQPPSRDIELLRHGKPDLNTLRGQISEEIKLLEPFERTGASASSGNPPPAKLAMTTNATAYPLPRRAGSRTPSDTSNIRGANYTYAEYGGHPGMWNNYSPAITERDLNYAQKLGINQIRTFLSYPAYTNNVEQFRKNLLDLVRAADQRGIGLMPVVGYPRQMMTNENHPGAEEWAKFLVDTLGKEPGLAFWDVCNEPDYPPSPTNGIPERVAFARHMATVFRRLDGHTPITIGFAYEPTMEKCVDDMDVLVFHDYQQTREAVRMDIEKARLAGIKAHKQVIDGEMGCVARANPYDMTLSEHMNAHMGFYLWELMIVSNSPRAWGDVHGIFYPDGTIRDPSIPMAVKGIFRNCDSEVMLERPNREGRVTRTIADARGWLANTNGDWSAGLDIAEVAANLLESAQLVPLHELPTVQVGRLRSGPEDRATLKALLQNDVALLHPYEQ